MATVSEVTHLSYSSLNLYLLCGHAWKQRYVEKVQTPTSPALVFGSAFHGTAEAYLQGADLEPAWEQSWGQQLERNPAVAWGSDTVDSCHADGLRMVRAKPVRDLLEQVRANYEPGEGRIERRVELRVPGVPVPIIGYVDLITRDGVPGDIKTAARMWTEIVGVNATGEPEPGGGSCQTLSLRLLTISRCR
jgi:hypothetical protein